MSERTIQAIQSMQAGTERPHFEGTIRRAGTGIRATMDGISNPLKVMAAVDRQMGRPAAEEARRVDHRA